LDGLRHEHLYEVISRNVIASGDFKDSAHENERLLGGSRVLLCTISTLSTRKLSRLGFTRIVPVQTVIIDEASQIEVGDYLPILAKYQTTLRKMVFIGDDKQRRSGGGVDEIVVC
jgi:superfamily I DNA and/or RNA helicase